MTATRVTRPDGWSTRRSTPRWIGLFLLTGLLLSADQAQASNDSLLDRLLTIEAGHQALCSTAIDAATVRSRIEAEAGELRRGLEDVPLPEAVGTVRDDAQRQAERIIAALNESVFTRLGLRASQDLHDPCNLLPSGVLAQKQGYCVGLAGLYLALAETANLPVHAVATPSHVFLRYDDGVTRINIETTQQGAAVPDEQYIEREKIADSSVRKGVFMRNLTADQFLAQVYNNLGVICSEREQFQQAALEYQEALDLDRHLPAAWYNWGNDLLRSGEYQTAIKVFTRSLKLNPNDVWALNNRGQAYRKSGNEEKARGDFEAALMIDPAFEQARQQPDAPKAP